MVTSITIEDPVQIKWAAVRSRAAGKPHWRTMEKTTTAEVVLCDFWHRIIKMPYTIALFSGDFWPWNPGIMLEEDRGYMKRPQGHANSPRWGPSRQPQPEMRHIQMNPGIESPWASVFPTEFPGIEGQECHPYVSYLNSWPVQSIE